MKEMFKWFFKEKVGLLTEDDAVENQVQIYQLQNNINHLSAQILGLGSEHNKLQQEVERLKFIIQNK